MHEKNSINPSHETTQPKEKDCLARVNTFIHNIEARADLNAYLHTYGESAKKQAQTIREKIANGQGGILAGKVIGLKDLFCYKDHPLSASSNILKGFVSQLNATAVSRLLNQDAIIIGHHNCDEFAMGSSNEHSAYGAVSHPLDSAYIPGGSSGGSAVAVAADLCDIALGTDTGGSVRQPAAWCGIIGLKPTYGRISRYGVVAFASSFDTVSIFSTNIQACATTLEAIAGHDPYDNTSSKLSVPPYSQLLQWKKKAKIAYFKEAINHPALDPAIKKNTLALHKKLTAQGHSLTPIDFPLLDYALPTYHCLTTAEASANLARYDGVRYGRRSEKAKNLQEVYTKTRTSMLGAEVKRRILLGTFVLSSDYYDAYYNCAQKVRRLLKNHMDNILSTYDFIMLPTTPTTALRKGTVNEPIQEYLADLYTVPASIAGVPAISIPNGTNEKGWPIGVQIIGKAFGEAPLLAFAKHIIMQFQS